MFYLFEIFIAEPSPAYDYSAFSFRRMQITFYSMEAAPVR